MKKKITYLWPLPFVLAIAIVTAIITFRHSPKIPD